MLWYDSIEAQKTGKPQQGSDLLIRLVKDLEDTRSEYKGYSYVRTIRNILIGKEDAAIAPFFKGKPYYGQFEALTLERVEEMMDALVSSYQLDVIHTEHGKLYCSRESGYDDANDCSYSFNSVEENKTVTDLKSLLCKKPDAWAHINEFRSALLDLYPNDKVKRNLIFHCVEEGIPKDLQMIELLDANNLFLFSNRLVKAVGCDEELAKGIISIWADALGIDVAISSGNDDTKAQELYEIATKYDEDGDHKNAIKYYVEAANSGSAIAAFNLAGSYELGSTGLRANQKKAFYWYEKAAELGDPDAQIETAKRYHYGNGVQQDQEECKRWLAIAEENKNDNYEIYSELDIDCAYYSWFGDEDRLYDNFEFENFFLISYSGSEAIELFENAAWSGYGGNYGVLGNIYFNGDYEGQFEIPISREKAYAWYKLFYEDYKAGKITLFNLDGVIEAFYWYAFLSILLKIKTYKETEVKQIWEDVVSLVEDSDDDITKGLMFESEVQFLYLIGEIFYTGKVKLNPFGENMGNLCSVEKDYKLSERALQLAKKFGDYKACVYLAEIYRYGLVGQADFKKAEHEAVFAVEISLGNNKDAIDWCQSYFVDSLDWDIRDSWEDIPIEDVFEDVDQSDNSVLKVLIDNDVCTLEDFREKGVEILGKNSSLALALWNEHLFENIENVIESYFDVHGEDEDSDEFELPFN
ncbi:tetratricopeptide repeat protein [Butyrivibrio sp. FCS006]|uniref:tetratricopeptide repeat protein n=1 Tax=Butyrivibrio sp. FCS006 TaxID=1280684 RepID=UPI000402954C|nr:tetratricopeptide repeat protein [Butyrivibrio sp. FCS006]